MTNGDSEAIRALPEFPTLDREPTWPNDKFLVAWFAYEEARSGWLVPGARRDVQLAFQRSSGSGVSRQLTRVTDQRYLQRFIPANEAHAHEYGLHPDIPAAEAERWVALGRLLFGREKGLVGRALASPAIRHGALKSTGFVVLSLIHRHGPISPGLLASTLRPLVHRQTVRTQLARAEEIGLIEIEGGAASMHSEWRENLLAYVRLNGFDRSTEALEELVADERLRYRSLLIGDVSMRIRLVLTRAMPCLICNETSEGGVSEHFPPKFWGGFDHPDLLHSLCRRHNIDLGIMVRDLGGPVLRPLVSSVGRTGPAPLWLVEAQRLYLDSYRQDDVELLLRSRQLVESNFLRWCAASSGSNSVMFERIDEMGERRVGRRTYASTYPERTGRLAHRVSGRSSFSRA